jgi:ATP-binding protein involved in chromosome partitioning
MNVCLTPAVSSSISLTLDTENELVPLLSYGVKTMSMGYLVQDKDPIVWRGLMVMKAIQQLLHEVDWGGLDILVLDLPPGTGDVQLTITQQVKLDGAIIISTPNLLSIKDSVKGINMFKKVEVPVLGMVQNMATFTCPECGTSHNIFGHDGVKEICKQLGMDLIGDIPLHPKIGEDADTGKPTVVAEPEGIRAKAFHDIASKVAVEINLHPGSE